MGHVKKTMAVMQKEEKNWENSKAKDRLKNQELL